MKHIVRFVRFVGRTLWGLLSGTVRFVWGALRFLVRELLAFLKAQLFLIPLLVVGLMVFLVYEGTLSLAEFDLLLILVVLVYFSILFGFFLRGVVDHFFRRGS